MPHAAVALAAAGRRSGIHGDGHWRRVGEAGLLLAERGGVSAHVVLLFAILHDCRRENDGHDPGHGARAGITPDPRLLSTGTASDAGVIRAFSDFRREVPGWDVLVARAAGAAGAPYPSMNPAVSE